MNDVGSSDYYMRREEKYWRQLGRLFRSSNGILPAYLDGSLAARAADESYQEFQSLLASLPHIGGESNMLTFTFVSSAAALAYVRVLERQGLPKDTVGEILNEVFADALASLPRIIKWWPRGSEFSRSHQNRLRAYAKRSKRRECPGDWVMEYVEGAGEDYDFGCDYTECLVLKFYHQMRAKKYMPYGCAVDFTKSRALQTGL